MKSKELGALGKGLRALWERNKFVLLVIAAGVALLLLPALPGGSGAAGESAAAAGEEADAFQVEALEKRMEERWGDEEDLPQKKPRREERKPRQERRPEKSAPKRESAPREEAVKAPAEQPAPVQDLGDEVDDEKAQAIRKFLTGLLEQMETPAEIKVYLPEKDRYKVFLEGPRMGALIGRRGETLDAIQQLTSYAVNRTGNRVRIQLDAEGYRSKREQSLQHLAQKTAAKAVRFRRNFTLEPMNAYERHVIHVALQDTAHVTTYSTGTEPNRRVVVAYDREKK